jgi:lysozyme family protein
MTDRDLVGFIIKRFYGLAYSDQPPLGPARYGITQAHLAAFMGRPVARDEVRAMTIDLAVDVLVSEYVFKPRFFDVLDPLVRLCAVDFAVAFGVPRGVRSLAYATQHAPPYAGVLEHTTITLVNRHPPDELRRDMLAYRARFHAKLTALHPGTAGCADAWAIRLATLRELKPGANLRD